MNITSNMKPIVSMNESIAKMNPSSMVSAASIDSDSQGQSPAVVAVNYLLFTLYSLVGTLIYYPSFIVNIPESNLEETLPKQDLCMKMGFSERICKKKIKCLFKNCDYLEDPIGYKLDKQYKKPCKRTRTRHEITEKSSLMTGGGRNKTRKNHKNQNWRSYLSRKMKEQMKKEYKKNIMNIILKKKQMKGKIKTKKYYGGNEKDLLNNKTCKNKNTKVLCSLLDGNVKYKPPNTFSKTLYKKKNMLKMFGGTDKNTEVKKVIDEDEMKERRLLIRSFFVEKIKTQTLFKLAIILKVMKQLFKDENISESEMNETRAPSENENIDVVFPWNFNDPNMKITDRIKCLNSHITQTTFDREKDPELYDKCFVCKHCTLKNTASKVWGGVIKRLLSGNKSRQFVELINNTYGILRKHIEFPFMTEKQYYLTTLISSQLVNYNLEIDKISTTFGIDGHTFNLKDLIVGIPSVSIINRESLHEHLDDLRKCYIIFHQIGIAQAINGIYYESLFRNYFKIQQEYPEEKLHFLKNVAFKNYELLYVKNQSSKKKQQGVYDKLYENEISVDEMKNFSYFENDQTLINLKNSENYDELSKQFSTKLLPQYFFLLNKYFFIYDNVMKNEQHEKEIHNVMKKIVMKII